MALSPKDKETDRFACEVAALSDAMSKSLAERLEQLGHLRPAQPDAYITKAATTMRGLHHAF